MSPTDTAREPRAAGCQIERLDAEACDRYLAWLLGDSSSSPPDRDQAANLVWALAHCDDGVTWGRYDTGEHRWALGSEVAPDVSPPIRREALQELRIFDEKREALIWRTEAGLRGRIIREAEHFDTADSLCPSDERRILRGDRVHRNDAINAGFTHIADQTGAQQVVPSTITNEDFGARRDRRQPLCLHLRHYYEQDPETGAVRIVATRLVKLDDAGTRGGR